MDDFVYASYLKGLKDAFEAKIEEERKAEAERVRIEEVKRLHEQRKNMAIPYYQFWSEFEKMINFGEQAQSDFDAFMDRIKKQSQILTRSKKELNLKTNVYTKKKKKPKLKRKQSAKQRLRQRLRLRQNKNVY